MNEIEAAAKVIHNRSPKCYESFGNEDDGCRCVVKATEVLSAVFVARVGCDQCGGTGIIVFQQANFHPGDAELAQGECPAEHVEIGNPYGGTVWADPNKVEWRCENWFVQFRTLYEGLTYERVELREFRMPCLPDSPHGESNCRWVPRSLEVTE